MSAVHAVALALLTVAVAACDQPPTAVVELPPVRLDFLNGPDDLPNVFRTATNAGFAIRDPSTGYIAMAGLPTPPSAITLCGGTMPFQTSSEMTEGELKGVLHDLRMGSDLNVFVYQIATFRGVCASTPFASGIGRMMAARSGIRAGPAGRSPTSARRRRPSVQVTVPKSPWASSRPSSVPSSSLS